MGLFDFFRKKITSTTPSDNPVSPPNSLESLLQMAATDPTVRQEFYDRLLTDDLFIVSHNSSGARGEIQMKEGEQVNIVSFPDGKIPVFTSTDRIFDKGVIQKEVEYLRMRGRDLFTMTKGATLILNVYSDYGKELLPNEIESMLDGTVLQPKVKQVTYDKAAKVLLGQPAVYPTEIRKAIVPLFEKHPEVKAAYMGWMHVPTSQDPPHYVFGIEGDGDLREIMNLAGNAAQVATNYSQIIDFVVIKHNDTISDYLTKQTQPFYRRSS